MTNPVNEQQKPLSIPKWLKAKDKDAPTARKIKNKYPKPK